MVVITIVPIPMEVLHVHALLGFNSRQMVLLVQVNN